VANGLRDRRRRNALRLGPGASRPDPRCVDRGVRRLGRGHAPRRRTRARARARARPRSPTSAALVVPVPTASELGAPVRLGGELALRLLGHGFGLVAERERGLVRVAVLAAGVQQPRGFDPGRRLHGRQRSAASSASSTVRGARLEPTLQRARASARALAFALKDSSDRPRKLTSWASRPSAAMAGTSLDGRSSTTATTSASRPGSHRGRSAGHRQPSRAGATTARPSCSCSSTAAGLSPATGAPGVRASV